MIKAETHKITDDMRTVAIGAEGSRKDLLKEYSTLTCALIETLGSPLEILEACDDGVRIAKERKDKREN